MKRVNLIATACVTAMLAVLTLNVAAQDFNTNERTFLTFSGSVELPGVTLQPGTYLFRLSDSQSNRHIIQVLSQDEKQIHATILAVPAERLEVTGENVVTFRETAEGATPALQYWYYPGDRIGHEFVYPKDQAMRIAKRTGQDVLSTEGEMTSADSAVSSVSPEGEMTEWRREGAAAPTAEDQTGTVQGTTGVSEMPRQAEAEAEAQAEPQPQAEPQAQAAPEPEPTEAETPEDPEAEAAATAQMTERPEAEAEGTAGVSAEAQMRAEEGAVGTAGQVEGQAGREALPRTASPLPLSGLIGLLSLGGALALRRVRK